MSTLSGHNFFFFFFSSGQKRTFFFTRPFDYSLIMLYQNSSLYFRNIRGLILLCSKPSFLKLGETLIWIRLCFLSVRKKRIVCILLPYRRYFCVWQVGSFVKIDQKKQFSWVDFIEALFIVVCILSNLSIAYNRVLA